MLARSSLALVLLTLLSLPSHADATCATEEVGFSATASTPATGAGTRTTRGLVFTDGSYQFVNSYPYNDDAQGEVVEVAPGILGIQDIKNDTISTQLTFTRKDGKNFSVASVTALDRDQGADGEVTGGYQGFGIRLVCYDDIKKKSVGVDTKNQWGASPTTVQSPLPAGADCTRLVVNFARHTGSKVDMVLTGLSLGEPCPTEEIMFSKIGVGTVTYRKDTYTDGNFQYRNSHPPDEEGRDVVVKLPDGTVGLSDPTDNTTSTVLTFTRTNGDNFSVASLTALDLNQKADGGSQGFGIRLACYNDKVTPATSAGVDLKDKWGASPTTVQNPLPTSVQCTRLVVNLANHSQSNVNMVLTGLTLR